VPCCVSAVTRLHVARPRYWSVIPGRDVKFISSSTLTSGSEVHIAYWNGKGSSGYSVKLTNYSPRLSGTEVKDMCMFTQYYLHSVHRDNFTFTCGCLIVDVDESCKEELLFIHLTLEHKSQISSRTITSPRQLHRKLSSASKLFQYTYISWVSD
jgi:hypothetical protein